MENEWVCLYSNERKKGKSLVVLTPVLNYCWKTNGTHKHHKADTLFACLTQIKEYLEIILGPECYVNDGIIVKTILYSPLVK